MAPRKDNSWTEIDTSGPDDSDVEEFKLNLNDLEEDTSSNGKRQESQDTRRGILTVSSPKAPEAEEDEEVGSEVSRRETQNSFRKAPARQTEVEDTDADNTENEQGMQFGGRKNRAHKRIQNLLGTVRQKDQTIQELAAKVQELSRKAHGAEKRNVSTQVDTYKRMMEEAENNLAKAIDENDGKAVAKYSKELADSTMRFNAMAAVDAELPDEAPEIRVPQAQQAPEVPDAAHEWVERNPWFKSDPKQHVIARMISQDLTQEGRLDPAEDEYWEEMDRRLTKYGVKPGRRQGRQAQNDDVEDQNTSTETVEQPTQARRRGSPLSSRNDEDVGNTRQFTRNGNRVVATPTENDKFMSERLGVDLATFMKEKYKYGNQDWKGYVPITIPNQ